VFWILLGLLCIGAGKVRLHYHAYLKAASRNDSRACDAMASELTLIHGVRRAVMSVSTLANCKMRCCGLTIDTTWRRFSGLWWGAWGPLTLIAYSVLRAWQTWLARYQTPHHRLQSGIDGILHIVDWLPVRLVGVVYALVGHGEKALPAWFASLGDRHSSQYQVLTRLAQYSLAREPHVDKVATPKAAVSMAKKTSLVVVVIMALLTIYGTLV
jgi:AmpE protein